MATLPERQTPVKQAINQRRVFGLHNRKLGRATKWLFPRNLESLYSRLLQAVIKNFQDQVTQLVIPQLSQLHQQQQALIPDDKSLHVDAPADTMASLFNTISLSSAAFLDKANIPGKMANFANVLSGFNSNQFHRMMKSIIGVDIFIPEPWLRDSITNFIHQNIALIKSLQTQSLSDLQGIVMRGFQQGTRPTDISAQLQKRYGVQKRRANLIARDQVGKLNGQLTQLRQKSAGVESYIWRTSLDERVRPEHRDREGQEFKWSEPPSDGNPGEPINCRCSSEPVIRA